MNTVAFPGIFPDLHQTAAAGLDSLALAYLAVFQAEAGPVWRSRLVEYGYPVSSLVEGFHLFQAAQTVQTARETALQRLEQAGAGYAAAESAAHQAYREFRTTVRFLYKDPASQVKLGVTGALPDDLQKFLFRARAAYTAARRCPGYRAGLASLNSLEHGLQTLDILKQADLELEAARKSVLQITQRLDKLMICLDEWATGLAKAVRRMLADHPEWARELIS
jgi:hypothetical protein